MYAARDELQEEKSALVERGKKSVSRAISTLASYDCCGKYLRSKEDLNEKVMKEYARSNRLPVFTSPDTLDMSETSDCIHVKGCTGGIHCYFQRLRYIYNQHADMAVRKDFVNSHEIFRRLRGKSNQAKLEPSDDYYALCNYRVSAYKLRSRQWAEVHVDIFHNATLEDKERGFERLVLTPAHKHIIRSQVKEHFRKMEMRATAAQDDLDLVRGKRQGLIILRHGVGKTCTAETIADRVNKPLYPITCGDLGSAAEDFEGNLKTHFTPASQWDCVMLLDEADFFSAKRKAEDLARNSIVPVFLRVLEYYKDLLFLTTNRSFNWSSPFRAYWCVDHDFDRETTVEVWQTFIQQTEDSIKDKQLEYFEIRKSEILKFAKRHWDSDPQFRWNSRQIRNAFHTAIAMAEFDAHGKEEQGKPKKIVLGHKQFKKIASTVEEFDKYTVETLGTTYEAK
ncbi:hypothetical protein K458DRAFT_483656 [Lentithecium fluviatile CBS 122367]|uniref:Uncharacterized protein n=1 Tax=Lentithecium fluviatile CBS 122367 TaxID=1168545 RepID=A0A6G1JI36_9PLEO|nr:hypothetical protein K458DRAFT_483656 [Lentithecium fluviatile CBS 122367]